MRIQFIDLPVMQWALILGIGFPLLMLAMGEFIFRYRKNRGISSTAANIRNLVIPSLVIWLALREVVGLPAESTFLKLVETAFWISLIFAALTFVNEVIFGAAAADSARARVPKLFLDLLRLILISIGGSIVLSKVWGANLASLATALGVGSIVIGLALQEPLGNVFAGLMLLFERPVSLGDWIDVDGKFGRVVEINWRSLHMLTLTQELVIVPNSILNKGTFKNLSRPTPLRIETIKLGFSYDDPPNKVKQILMDVIRDTPGVLSTPSPVIRTFEYADFSINYLVILPVPSQEELGKIRDDFMTRVWYAAQRHGLNIPFPIRTVIHENQEQVTARSRPQPFELLKRFPLWSSDEGASEAELQEARTLATDARFRKFTTGETIVQAGQPLEGIYLVIEGQAILQVLDRNDYTHQIAEVGPGEFFGESSIASSQSSEFTVKVARDLSVLLLTPDAVHEWMNHRPRLAREIGTVQDHRRRAAQASRKIGSSNGDNFKEDEAPTVPARKG